MDNPELDSNAQCCNPITKLNIKAQHKLSTSSTQNKPKTKKKKKTQAQSSRPKQLKSNSKAIPKQLWQYPNINQLENSVGATLTKVRSKVQDQSSSKETLWRIQSSSGNT
jgi:hypothetical protein